MKKLLTLIGGVALTATAAFGQLTNGSTAPDWTLTDINGTTWNLYTLTAQGKTVFIDVSATWCGPCWNYHNTNALEDLMTHHGPTGTVDQMAMVFFIEGDGTTTNADLNGTGSNTQGNWVTGTNYPIIDPAASTINAFNSDYAIGYFPTIYMICPDNKIYEVGQQPEAGLVAGLNNCSYSLDALPVSAASLGCATTYSPSFSFRNNSISAAITSCTVNFNIDGGTPQTYNWTGNLAAAASTTITLPSQTVTAGSHTLNITLVNPNNGTDNNLNNNTGAYPFYVNLATPTTSPVAEPFTSTTYPPTDWALINPDAGTTFARVTNTGNPAPSLKLDAYNYAAVGAQDQLIVVPMNMSAATSATLTFDVAYRPYDATYFEKLEVFVSSDCGVTWTSVYNKANTVLATGTATTTAWTPNSAANWRNESVSLSSFVGQGSVFVKFVSTNGYGNNLYLDNINVQTVTGIGNDQVATSSVLLYPNPANDLMNVSFVLNQTENVTVNVYNAIGELVNATAYNNMAAGQQNVQINTANLSAGMYMVEIVSGTSRTQSRMTVAH
jgi:Secretion system C-terminal sorting domain